MRETTIWSIISDTFTNLIDLEKSVLASILLILNKPRKIVENYWHGNRRYYPSPGKLLLYALAVAAIHLTYVNNFILGTAVNSNMVESQILFWIVFFPLLSLTSLIAFIGKRQRFTRHLVSIMYVASCYFILITILQDILIFFNIDVIGAGGLMIFFFAVFVWNSLVFNAGESVGRKLLGILLQIIVFASIIVILSFIIYSIVPKAVNFGS